MLDALIKWGVGGLRSMTGSVYRPGGSPRPNVYWTMYSTETGCPRTWPDGTMAWGGRPADALNIYAARVLAGLWSAGQPSFAQNWEFFQYFELTAVYPEAPVDIHGACYYTGRYVGFGPLAGAPDGLLPVTRVLTCDNQNQIYASQPGGLGIGYVCGRPGEIGIRGSL